MSYLVLFPICLKTISMFIKAIEVDAIHVQDPDNPLKLLKHVLHLNERN